ncbi:MAG: hypothetical protein HQL61_07915, partial [Magnetococcales bacterium]|nr:hypothetical protein [Nitrospirota bacterium]
MKMKILMKMMSIWALMILIALTGNSISLAWQKYPLPTMGGTGTIVINAPSDNETVVYDQATETWVNAALSAVARDSLSCTAPGLTYD